MRPVIAATTFGQLRVEFSTAARLRPALVGDGQAPSEPIEVRVGSGDEWSGGRELCISEVGVRDLERLGETIGLVLRLIERAGTRGLP